MLACVASVSFGAGLAIWPAGALALAWRLREPGPRTRLSWLLVWLFVGAIVGWSAAHGVARPAGQPGLVELFAAPALPLRLFVTTVGGPFGTLDSPLLAGLAGVVLLALGAVALWRARYLAAEVGAFALTLCGVSWGGAALVAVSRTWVGENAGLSSRYVTMSVLAVAGLWVLLRSLPEGAWRRGLLAGLGALVALGVGLSLATQFSQGAKVRRERAHAAEVLAGFHDATDDALTCLYPVPAVVR